MHYRETKHGWIFGEHLSILLKVISLNERGGSETTQKKNAASMRKIWSSPWDLIKQKQDTHLQTEIFNEIEWLNTDYKSRKYFMEPDTLFLWETAPWV